MAVRPGWRALHVAQDRLREKTFLAELGIAVTPFRPIDGPATLARAVTELGTPAILKTSRFGYDGKGQIRIDAGAGKVRISVEDNGPGIPAEVRDQLFMPFTTTKATGLGLGLVISGDLAREFGAVDDDADFGIDVT